MLVVRKLFVAVLLLGASAWAQSLAFGTTTQAFPILSPGNPDLGMSFTLAGGGFLPTGKIKAQQYTLNHFSFSGGHFLLNRTDANLCQQGCNFDGTFDSWSFGVVPINKDCSVVTGTLTGTLDDRPARAEYSQMFCHLPSTNYMGGGELSVIYE